MHVPWYQQFHLSTVKIQILMVLNVPVTLLIEMLWVRVDRNVLKNCLSLTASSAFQEMKRKLLSCRMMSSACWKHEEREIQCSWWEHHFAPMLTLINDSSTCLTSISLKVEVWSSHWVCDLGCIHVDCQQWRWWLGLAPWLVTKLFSQHPTCNEAFAQLLPRFPVWYVFLWIYLWIDKVITTYHTSPHPFCRNHYHNS